MKCHLMSLGWKVWRADEKEYNISVNLPTDREKLDQYKANAKSLNETLSGLTQSVFVKVMQCNTSYQAWEKLKTIYEGASKVKQSKLQSYNGQFEILK